MPERKQHTDPIAEAAADHAVRKVFAILGVDVDSPESIEEFREDLRFGKRLRKLADHGATVIVGALFLGMVLTVWQGIKALLHKGG